jgi:hypothetical protein
MLDNQGVPKLMPAPKVVRPSAEFFDSGGEVGKADDRRGVYHIFKVIISDESLGDFKQNMSDTERCFRIQEAISFFLGCKLEKITVMKEDEI